MELIKALWIEWVNRRRLKKLKAAAKVLEEAGYTVCTILERGKVAYLVDNNGTIHRIGHK